MLQNIVQNNCYTCTGLIFNVVNTNHYQAGHFEVFVSSNHKLVHVQIGQCDIQDISATKKKIVVKITLQTNTISQTLLMCQNFTNKNLMQCTHTYINLTYPKLMIPETLALIIINYEFN